MHRMRKSHRAGLRFALAAGTLALVSALPAAHALMRAQDAGVDAGVEVLGPALFKTLSNPGVTSVQMLAPHNSTAARMTITQVTVQPGASQDRHRHASSEQVWIVQQGSATLLLGNGASRPIHAGEVVRTPAGEVHGVKNDGDAPFIYLAATTPPIDFSPAYIGKP